VLSEELIQQTKNRFKLSRDKDVRRESRPSIIRDTIFGKMNLIQLFAKIQLCLQV